MTVLQAAAEVLRCFSPQRPDLSVAEVAELLGLPKSNVSRLLRAMQKAAFLERIETRGRYRPGLLMFEMGHAYRRGSPLLARAQAAIERVSHGCGHTGYVSVLDGGAVVGVGNFEGTRVLRVGTPTGIRLPAFATATGRSLLARLPDSVIASLFPDPLPYTGAQSPAALAALMGLIGTIRRDGYAISRDEANAGVESLAVSVADQSEVVSLCIVYPTSMVESAERRGILAALMREARGIAALTGDDFHLARPACPVPNEQD
jgi:DNA-binding IclR family transcriptional regulator